MSIRPLTRLAVLLGTLMIGACSVTGGQAAPEPTFDQLRAETPFELRAYPELVLVKTAMSNDDRAFQRLFRYISGANAGKREIAMTAPVLQSTGTSEGAKIAMTAPVLQSDGESGAEMAFILTSDFTPETAPMPTDPAVELATLPRRQVAVVTFNGRANDALVAEWQDKLDTWMAENGLLAIGPAELAQYNPPWTIPSLRRNELLVPVAAE